MNIGLNIRKIREKNNKNMQELADILKVAKITYNHYETQEKIIPIERLNVLCNYFNISFDYVFELNTKKNYKIYNSEINKNLCAKRLKEFRKENKITQTKIANLVGTVQSTFAKYETEINLIPTAFLYTICKKYNISADYLLGKTNEPKYLKEKDL